MLVSRSARRRQAWRASGWFETSLQARHIAWSCSSLTEGVENNVVRSSSGLGSARLWLRVWPYLGTLGLERAREPRQGAVGGRPPQREHQGGWLDWRLVV